MKQFSAFVSWLICINQMDKSISTEVQHQDEAHRRPREDETGEESFRYSYEDNRANTFSERVAWSTERKPQSEVEKPQNTALEAFIAKLRAMPRQDFAHALPALEAAILSPEPKDAEENTEKDRAQLSEAKVRARVESAHAGKETDISDLEVDERSAFFDAYYNQRTKFDKEKIKPENKLNRECKRDFILRWIKKEFEDREKWNMMQADLKKLDESAWSRLQDWLRDRDLPPGFNLPAKKDGFVRLKPSSTGMSRGELIAKLERGEPIRPEDVRAITRDGVRASRLRKSTLT